MQLFYNEKDIEVGIDEVGRGCLVGPVYAAAVIWPKQLNPEIEHPVLKDSKKYSKKKLPIMEQYIKDNCIDYAIGIINPQEIDEINILQSTFKAMHQALDKLETRFDSIIVDGNRFPEYYDKNKEEWIQHNCIISGDDKYASIAAASIIAKTARDRYIQSLCDQFNILDTRYKLSSNVGYASKDHRNGIKEFGITQFHRRTFGICKEYINNITIIENENKNVQENIFYIFFF